MNDLLQELETLAAKHDWFYEYSDDHSVWKKGFDKQREIDRLVYYCNEAGLYKEAVDILSKYWNK